MWTLYISLTLVFRFLAINGQLNEEKRIQELEKDLKSLHNLVDELREVIHIQNDRIKVLEKRTFKLEDANHEYTVNISELKQTTAACLEQQKEDTARIKNIEDAVQKMQYDRTPKDDSSVLRKRILGPTTVPSEGNVAFYAYMSTSLVNPSSFHTLIFDTVITNDGNGYHPNTGVFIVPESGLYVFTWVMRQWTHATHGTELMVNKISSGSVFLHSMTDDHSVTGLVVIHANQGDDVFVRTQVDNNYGNIGSDYHGKTSFAGWKIN